MSLETLLEAARFVEQQEQRAKQLQYHQQPPIAKSTFKIIAPAPVTPQHTLTQLPQSPPAALVPVSLVQQPTIVHAVVAAPTNGIQLAAPPPPPPPRPLGALVQQTVMVATPQHQPGLEVVKPQPIAVQPAPPVLITTTNGFEKPQLIIDDPDLKKQQQQQQQRHHIPSVIRSGTREVHNKLEKNRRAHLKECFELLKKQLPPQQDEKKCSNLSILHSALRYIQVLKKKERDNEHEMERLARDKIAAQQRFAALKKEMGAQWDNIDFSALLPITDNIAVPSILTIKDERIMDTEETHRVSTLQPTQLSVPISLAQVGFPVSQGLVVGLHKVALVSKSLPLMGNSLTHLIAAPQQLNGKVVPLVNAQYLMKPVVVVSSASTGATVITPRPS